MWSLAQSAPPIWSSYFLSNIPEDWLPQDESESLFYREIHRLAVNCQKQQLMRPPETKFSSHIDSRSVALSSDGNILAISDSQGEIRFWLMVSGLSYSNIIKSPVPQIRCTAISPRYLNTSGTRTTALCFGGRGQ